MIKYSGSSGNWSSGTGQNFIRCTDDGESNQKFAVTGSGGGHFAGSLGIGTDNPSTLLHLNSTSGSVVRLARQDGSVVANDSLGKIEFYTNDATNTGVAGYIDVQAEGGAAGGSMIFGTGTAGSASEQVRIAADGSLGIGTSSPSVPLEVAGNIFCLLYTSDAADE